MSEMTLSTLTETNDASYGLAIGGGGSATMGGLVSLQVLPLGKNEKALYNDFKATVGLK